MAWRRAVPRLMACGLPANGCVRLLPDDGVCLSAGASLPLTVTGALLAEVTHGMLAFSPYFGRFGRAGMATRASLSGGAGKLKIWPG
jgi:hypothetical protein